MRKENHVTLSSKQKWIGSSLIILFCIAAFLILQLPQFLPNKDPLAIDKTTAIVLEIVLALLLVAALRKSEWDGKKLFLILVGPLFLASLCGYLYLLTAKVLVDILDFPRSERILIVENIGHGTRSCLGQANVTFENYSYETFTLCMPLEVSSFLHPGSALRIKGKRGLGGLLVLDYERI